MPYGLAGLAARRRLAITPSTPIAAFVKRLRCRKCRSQSVLATRKPSPRPNELRDVRTLHLQADVGRACSVIPADARSAGEDTQPRYNVCPTDPVDTIVQRDGKRELVSMRWGLIPRWWSKTVKDVKMATFNARVETVETKPFFRDAFKRTDV
jgi:hypothetical protein